MVQLKVGVAMSGGVDSTMAASLVYEQGHDVHGFFMLLPLPGLDEHLSQVRQVAGQLTIPLTVIDMRRHFTDQVVGYFTATYQSGLTPNPCIHCNHAIKFGLLAEAMRTHGMDRIATGHYARIDQRDGQSFVARGVDRQKDQSYFLARLDAGQVGRILFPLGRWTKERIYHRAAGLGFRFTGQESQDVCFLASGLPAFLAGQGIGEQAGPVVTRDGRQLGEHRGVWQYTIGQRRGLGLPDATPWYVVGLDGLGNRVVVGKHDELFSDRCTIHSLRWTHQPPTLPWRGLVQLRSRHQPASAELIVAAAGTWQLTFASPQCAIAPGQFAVFYEDDLVVGSGVIAANTETERSV
ncbi:MAG: tRNA 2-thiouridine(34) synthase MnmA [Desulfobulbus sp.]|nr:tRNA 2-thiouridine(34) synthase MnmA [Desulfobulbus sp.]